MTEASFSSFPRRETGRRLTTASIVLGVGLSAFFDGILLHQVLQWHHLLSLAEGATWQEWHNQILADGLFHVAAYVVAVVGLVLLWRSRGELVEAGAGRRLAAYVLVGFGLWNVIDVVGFHWLAGIHRVRVDVPDPLAWDLAWLATLGAGPLIAGAWLRTRSGGGRPGGGAAAVLGITVMVAGSASLIPVAGESASIVIFRPDVTPLQAFTAAVATGARIADISPSGRSMVIVLPDADARWDLYRNGALLVGGGALAGCGSRL